MKLRIKTLSHIGHFAQVKHGLFSGWKTIGEHTHGYGLYPESHLDHPLPNSFAAELRAKEYRGWFRFSEDSVFYTEV